MLEEGLERTHTAKVMEQRRGLPCDGLGEVSAGAGCPGKVDGRVEPRLLGVGREFRQTGFQDHAPAMSPTECVAGEGKRGKPEGEGFEGRVASGPAGRVQEQVADAQQPQPVCFRQPRQHADVAGVYESLGWDGMKLEAEARWEETEARAEAEARDVVYRRGSASSD